MAATRVKFGNAVFGMLFKNPEGPDIPLSVFTGVGDNVAYYRCGLQAGSTYQPGAHEQSVVIIILEGLGNIMLGDAIIEYRPHSVIEDNATPFDGLTNRI